MQAFFLQAWGEGGAKRKNEEREEWEDWTTKGVTIVSCSVMNMERRKRGNQLGKPQGLG